MIYLAFILLLVPRFAVSSELRTWDEVINEATARNADITAARRTIDKARAGQGSAFAPFLPQISGTASYSRANSSFVTTGVGGGVGSAPPNTDQYNVGLSVTQNIFNGFQDQGKRAAADAGLDSARAAARVTAAQLRYDLKSAFSRTQYGRALAALNRNVLERRRDNRDLVELRFEGGSENKGSYLRAKAAYRSAGVDVAKTERDLQVSGETLAKLLGRAPGEMIVGTGELAVPTAAPGDVDLAAIVRGHPAHQQAQADVRAAEANLGASEGGFLPSLNVNGTLARNGTSFPPETNRWSVGATLTVPIFTGLSTEYDVDSATAERDRQEALRTRADQATYVQLRGALEDFRTAVERVAAQREAVAAAEVRAQVARGKYANGLQSFEDWDLIENDLITQQQQLLSTQLAAVTAEASYAQAQGMGVTP